MVKRNAANNCCLPLLERLIMPNQLKTFRYLPILTGRTHEAKRWGFQTGSLAGLAPNSGCQGAFEGALGRTFFVQMIETAVLTCLDTGAYGTSCRRRRTRNRGTRRAPVSQLLMTQLPWLCKMYHRTGPVHMLYKMLEVRRHQPTFRYPRNPPSAWHNRRTTTRTAVRCKRRSLDQVLSLLRKGSFLSRSRVHGLNFDEWQKLLEDIDALLETQTFQGIPKVSNIL